MDISFNLVDQPWIQCIRNDGKLVELGLADTLAQAHELALWDESPLVEVSLYRLLLTIVHRSYDGPPDVKTWRTMWESGSFDVGEYLVDDSHAPGFGLVNDVG